MAEMYDYTVHSQNPFHHGLPTPDSELGKFLDRESFFKRHHTIKITIHTEIVDKMQKPSLDGPPIPRSNITMLCHTPEQLVEAIQKFTGEHDIVIPGLEDMQRYYSSSFKRQQNNHQSSAEDVAQLSLYFTILDRLFFFSSLQNLCAIRVETTEGYHAGQLDSHRSNWRTKVPSTHACLITIGDLRIKKPGLRYETRMKRYLATLLHEMLHAFFEVYGCMCRETCVWRYNTHVGIHGNAWQGAALAIEDATERLLGNRIDMDRVDSLAMNWIAARDLPFDGTVDLARWGMTYGEVRTAYDYYVELYNE